MRAYDIAVIGGGAAGCMAAIRASEILSQNPTDNVKKIALIERNSSVGKKILLTGKGRCNITNIAPMDAFMEKFGKAGLFLRPAFSAFFNKDLMQFFEKYGLPLKSERQGRIFPVTYKARSVVEVLSKAISKDKGIDAFYSTRLADMKQKGGVFELDLRRGEKGKEKIEAKKIILATGGASYKMTGSTGDGFRISRTLGHRVERLRPALVPLRTRETWVKELQGLVLKNVRLTFKYSGKKVISNIGELLFTHFGVSGPLVLDLSGEIVIILNEHKEIALYIDLKPGLEPDKLEERLLRDLKEHGKKQVRAVMEELLPVRMAHLFVKVAGIDTKKTGSQITHKERKAILNMLKAFPLTITGSLSLRRGMITAGGVAAKEINPKTMESRLIPGLYFAGEIIEGEAPSGGYNLQQAFSTGYLAGESAAS